ncbi:MAG TPA: VWA domain-containing protein [Polyangiaceae bacterium]|nr:VWA domain-containing protein [Polyangiaceae bacterium]
MSVLRRLAHRPVLLVFTLLGVTPCLLVLAAWARFFDLPYVRFDRPPLTLPVAAITLWIALRLLDLSARISPLRRTLIEFTTGAAALAAALCTIGLEVGRPLDRLTVVVAVDRSRSIDLVPAAANRIASELRVAELGMGEDDRIAVVAFGANAQVEDPARPKSRLPSAQRADVARDGTDLGTAIRQSLAEIPPDSAARVVLLSDGVATRGDTTEAALAATALGVPVDAVPLDQGAIPDVRVVSVRVPARAAEGETLDLRIVTQATQATEVEARVYRDGELVRSGPTRLGQGEDVIYLREVAPGPGLHRYDVELSAPNATLDRSVDDNAGSAFVRVRGPSTALVLESEPALAAAMVKALESAAFRVDAAGPSGLPGDLAAFSRYDLVVLGDISAPDFSSSQLEALRSYVRDLGGGLLLMGGDHALGPGGYARTPVEEISPVSFDLKQERRRASLAEVIAVDYSGSMSMSVGGKTKLELANEAAARSAELLGEGDRLGVMHVDTIVSWTVPLAPVRDKADIEARIRKVGPGGGGIFVDLTLAAAYQALRRENVQLKHLLLFSDGNDAEERGTAPSLVSQGKRSGITTSVVALGNGSDVPALARMAELGGGRFYLIEDATRLPAVFAQETILASRSAINEVAFVPKASAPNAVLRGIDFGATPALTGYVVTIPKARAQVLLTGPENDPILATWSAGVGRSGVFTSDYKDRWGRAWTDWDGAARLFAQLGRDLARRVDDPHVRWEAEATGGELSLRATVFDDRGRHEAQRRLRARVGGPDGFSRDVPLETVGAGSYATKIPLSRPGAYLATLVDEQSEQALATTGAALSAGEELRPTGTDRGELRRIAALSGGKLRDTLAGVFNDREARRFAYAPFGPWLALIAASALLLSVGSRRLALPDFMRRPTKKTAPAADGENTLSGNETKAENRTLGALRAKKERRGEPRTDASPSPETAPPLVIRPSEAQTPPHTEAPIAAASPSERSDAPTEPAKRSAAEILLERRRARTRR